MGRYGSAQDLTPAARLAFICGGACEAGQDWRMFMARKRSFKDKIGTAVYEKKELNKKVLTMQKSFQEVRHLVEGKSQKEK